MKLVIQRVKNAAVTADGVLSGRIQNGLLALIGIVERDEALLRRALALLDKARLLLPQNTDPQINETVLSGQGECIDAGVSGRCAEKQRGAGRSRRFSAAGAGARRAV